MMIELFGKEALHSFAETPKDYVLVALRHLYDETARTVFVKSGFLSREFCSSLNEYNRLQNRIEISEIKGSVRLEKRLYATHESGAEKKMVNSFVTMRTKTEAEK